MPSLASVSRLLLDLPGLLDRLQVPQPFVLDATSLTGHLLVHLAHVRSLLSLNGHHQYWAIIAKSASLGKGASFRRYAKMQKTGRALSANPADYDVRMT
jgi:hypothetical protein